ncbi:MAG: Ribosome maturation factor RimM [Thermotoga sp. 50_1627]|uniref:ribosome maturation factor RimM n=1 Tax=Pseudothermotoga sp. TaxID=2033661 RepID=UPI00076DC4E6|nr:MAG: Ribosome maturation factor RimM [Thermotoga sp. 50_64]KUK25150.1 MAG: Ribosome maturation factor RimM [Thermotoga sp. 50_1627]MBC7115666.1 16S rRNA processing protein RimM [Pseudothermotoga sp.]MDK2924001.1 rRNA processing protein RimM [Pseudothermotoga sp.]HBT38525.1 16S rRNA processing protein RimM [Pseudothermotoga sp.]
MSEYIVIGKITRTHGLFGNVKVFPLTNVREVFSNLKQVFIKDEARNGIYRVTVQRLKKVGKEYLLKIEGIDSLEKAKKIVGLQLAIRLEDLPKLKTNEYYFYQLLNVEVYDVHGRRLGKVVDIIETGSNDVAVVKSDSAEILVPMTKECVVEFEPQKKLVVRLLEWM